jgi:soluble lytic murein transglycosylase-like protein
MTVFTARQVAAVWEFTGGPHNRDVEWVAIAMGESGLRTDALSPAGAIGLWQIMPFHAAEFGYSVGQLYEPAVNALIAVRLSGYGTNCAAWDSAYANIYASGRYRFLGFPEQGSADYNNLPAAANELGRNPPYTVTTSVPPVGSADYGRALAHSNYMTSQWLPHQRRLTAQNTSLTNRLFKRGWRP